MVSVDEFRRKHDEYLRATHRAFVRGVLLVILGILVAVTAWYFVVDDLVVRWGQGVRQLLIIVIYLPMFLWFIPLILVNRKHRDETVLHCPHCRANLAHVRRGRVVIASKHCPECGRRVLHKDDGEADSC